MDMEIKTRPKSSSLWEVIHFAGDENWFKVNMDGRASHVSHTNQERQRKSGSVYYANEWHAFAYFNEISLKRISGAIVKAKWTLTKLGYYWMMIEYCIEHKFFIRAAIWPEKRVSQKACIILWYGSFCTCS